MSSKNVIGKQLEKNKFLQQTKQKNIKDVTTSISQVLLDKPKVNAISTKSETVNTMSDLQLFSPSNEAKTLMYSYNVINSDYIMADDTYNVILIEGALGSLNVTLPLSSNVLDGFFVYISNQTAFNVTVNPALGETIGFGGSYALSGNNTVQFIVDYQQKNWSIISGTGSGPLPPPTPIVLSSQIWVDKAGNDITGTGDINAPFLTIGAAMASITNTAISNVINVGVGSFVEDVVYKENTSLKGVSSDVTFIIGSFTRDPAWISFGRIEFDDISFFPAVGSIVMNFTGFNFTNITFNNAEVGSLVIDGGNTGFNPNLYIINCFSSDITLNGVNAQYINGLNMGGSFTYNCLGSADVLNFQNMDPVNTLVLHNTFPTTPTVTIKDQCFTSITTTGQFSLSGTNDALVNMTLSGGTILTRYTDAFGLSYTNTYYIGVNNVKAALDYLASSSLSYATITAHSGGGQGSAIPITTQSVIVNSAHAHDSVILPLSTTVLGQSFYVRNNSNKVLDIYPQVGEQINVLGVNAPFKLSAGVNIQFKCMTSGNYYSF